jgi:hypothetical protein
LRLPFPLSKMIIDISSSFRPCNCVLAVDGMSVAVEHAHKNPRNESQYPFVVLYRPSNQLHLLFVERSSLVLNAWR